jgi:hypothetical protein
VLENKSNDRRFIILDMAISRFVEGITELHRLVPIQWGFWGLYICLPDGGPISRRKSTRDPWLSQPDESFPKARLSSLGKCPLSRNHPN